MYLADGSGTLYTTSGAFCASDAPVSIVDRQRGCLAGRLASYANVLAGLECASIDDNVEFLGPALRKLYEGALTDFVLGHCCSLLVVDYVCKQETSRFDSHGRL
nr:hypothetical protein CFP56_19253 [Quercus suber]